VALHYRAAASREAAPAWSESASVRTESGQFVLEVPAASVLAPGLEYWIEADGAAIFAGPEAPYFVTVVPSDDARRAESALRANGGRRSRARVEADYVDFGARGGVSDRYVRTEADYSYSLYRAVYTIRIGGGALRGETPEPGLAGMPVSGNTPGLDYGFAEIRFRLGERVFFDGRGLLGATDEGFQPGGAAALLLGHPETVYVQLGLETLGRIGTCGWLKLRWDTVPRVPMAITLALSDFPARERPTGVRLALEATHDIGPLTLLVRAGYQARDAEIGGATAGLGMQYAF
jgi:hypothetical protein